jgi:signal peptidase II
MKKKRQFNYLLISLIIILLDQGSKIAVRHYMPYQSFSVIGEFFYMTHIENPGAAFGLNPGSIFGLGHEATWFNRIFLSVVAFVLVFVILIMQRQAKHFLGKLSFSLIIGGAIGNLIDRVIFGSVTDFFDFIFPFFGMERWPVFNVADSAIVVAVVLLLYYTIFLEHKERKEEAEEEAEGEVGE